MQTAITEVISLSYKRLEELSKELSDLLRDLYYEKDLTKSFDIMRRISNNLIEKSSINSYIKVCKTWKV